MTIAPHTPIQYIMGRTKFCGLDFIVDERVLIPRPETELLVQAAIDTFNAIRNTQYAIRILDLGTGSGAIAISLTKNVRDCNMVASDISEGALEVARSNALAHGVSDRIEFIAGDLFRDIAGEFDIIACNPPYVARHEFADLQKEVLSEPRISLAAGDDGLDFYRRIIPEAPRYLKMGGYLIMEMGFGQREPIEEIISETADLQLIEIKKDFNGIDRIIILKNLKVTAYSLQLRNNYG